MNYVFSFVKPSPTSMVASVRIARFLAGQLGAPLLWDNHVLEVGPDDTLFIVNGAFAFCKYLPDLAVAVRMAERLVWVQNDYTIVPPKASGAAESPFRKAFVQRAAAGLPPIDYWTTVAANVNATAGSRYINWNSLTYNPVETGVGFRKDLFYYGSYRAGRVAAFRKYLLNSPVPVYVSSPSRKFIDELGLPIVGVVGDAIKENFQRELASHGLGLYIEDEKSHTAFHSPANRFYEMLGAGLPMVFQPESADMLGNAGFDVTPWLVESPDDVLRHMKRRDKIGMAQREHWHRPYVNDLKRAVRKALMGAPK